MRGIPSALVQVTPQVNHMARWGRRDGSLWPPDSGGWIVAVNAVAFSAGTMIVGGAFTAIGGVAANNIARWDGPSLVR